MTGHGRFLEASFFMRRAAVLLEQPTSSATCLTVGLLAPDWRALSRTCSISWLLNVKGLPLISRCLAEYGFLGLNLLRIRPTVRTDRPTSAATASYEVPGERKNAKITRAQLPFRRGFFAMTSMLANSPGLIDFGSRGFAR